MTYIVQSYASARIVVSTNHKASAHRIALKMPGCAVAAIRDGKTVGTAFFVNGRRVALQPPSPVSGLYLDWLRIGHGFEELPPFSPNAARPVARG